MPYHFNLKARTRLASRCTVAQLLLLHFAFNIRLEAVIEMGNSSTSDCNTTKLDLFSLRSWNRRDDTSSTVDIFKRTRRNSSRRVPCSHVVFQLPQRRPSSPPLTTDNPTVLLFQFYSQVQIDEQCERVCRSSVNCM